MGKAGLMMGARGHSPTPGVHRGLRRRSATGTYHLWRYIAESAAEVSSCQAYLTLRNSMNALLPVSCGPSCSSVLCARGTRAEGRMGVQSAPLRLASRWRNFRFSRYHSCVFASKRMSAWGVVSGSALLALGVGLAFGYACQL